MIDDSRNLLLAVDIIKKKVASAPQVGVVLGSGLGGVIDPASVTHKFSYSDLSCFPAPTVPGHEGNLLFCIINEKPVAVAQGRFHFYEGHPLSKVVLPVRLFAALGVETIILTCAAGGIADGLNPGSLMAVTDHINLMGANPLVGASDFVGARFIAPYEGRDRFVDMTGAYDLELIALAEKAAGEAGIELKKGVLAAMSGPSYETPAEIRMLRTLGADAVSMSTVPEVIVARYLGMRVLAIALITNRAAGLSEKGPEHEEVLEEAGRSGEKVRLLMERVLKNL